MLRSLIVGACVAMAAIGGCAAPDSSLDNAASVSTTEPTSTTPTSSSTTSTSTTAATTTTTMTATTTSRPVTSDPVFDEPSSWIGIEFEAVTSHPFVELVAILANLDYASFVIEGEPATVYPWYIAMTANAFTGPTYYGLIVGDTPHPYRITEIEQEEGVPLPRPPEPGTTHWVHIWAIRTLTDSTYLVTDAIAAELDADLLYGWTGDFRSILDYTYSCDLDTSVRQAAPFAFFAYSDELEIDKKYPANYAFAFHNEEVESVPGEHVSCVVRFDPENY